MGFYVMVVSMLLGLLALKIGFSQFKEKKDKFLSILTSLAGLALVLVAVWLGWPKYIETPRSNRGFSDEFLGSGKKICYTINMKILIPTAKEMNTDLPRIEVAPLRPESQAVLDALALYSSNQLESFYKVSAEKAEEEFQNIQALKNQTAQHYPALKLFDGLMYRHIKRDKLTEAEQAYLENHVFITSALYGVVPALSPMAPHRLDFLMKLKVAGKTLKSHWKSDYDEAMNGEDLIFSLLSSEFETVFSKEIREKMVTFKFMEDRDGKLKIHSTISKKARGDFLTALIENQVQTVEEARRLSFTGFAYREDLSQPKELVFVKEV